MRLEEISSPDKTKATRDALKQLRYIAAKEAEGVGIDFNKYTPYCAINIVYTFFGKHSHLIE